jgi:hypothetical protein
MAKSKDTTECSDSTTGVVNADEVSDASLASRLVAEVAVVTEPDSQHGNA